MRVEGMREKEKRRESRVVLSSCLDVLKIELGGGGGRIGILLCLKK